MLLAEYESSSEEFELLQLKEKGLSERTTSAARLRLSVGPGEYNSMPRSANPSNPSNPPTHPSTF